MVTDIKKGYKLTEIGEIPFDWDLKNVEEISSVTTGNKDTQNKSENGLYDFYVRSQKVEKINSYSFDGEAVLTAGDGVGVGKVYHYVKGKFDYHQRVYKISDFKNVDGKFFFYYFAENFMKEVRKYNSKTSVDSVRRHMITEMKVPIPPMLEQLKISEILTAADEQMEITKQLIEKNKELKKGLMQQLLKKGIGHVEFQDTDFGQIPKEWSIVQLEEVLKIGYGKNQRNVQVEKSEIPILGTGGIIGWSKEALYDKPSVLIGRKGTIDKPMYIEKPFWTIDTLFYTHISSHIVNPKFIYYLFQTIDWYKYNEATGVPSLSAKNISKIKFACPPLLEQQKIANILSTVDDQIEAYEKEKQKQIELKKALMQQLLTGKIRVTV